MKRLSFFVAPVLFASVLTGCPLLKKKEAADDSLDAATVTVAGTGAKNEKDVLRYGDEESLDEVAVIGKDGTKARNFPGNGPEVATLAKGTVVKKMAKRFSTGVLVMFDDPVAGDGSKLMGWVTPTSFDTAAPKPVWTPPKIVDAGAVVVKTDAGSTTTTVDAGGSAKTDAGAATADAGGGGGGGATDAGGGGGGGGGLAKPARGAVTSPPVSGKCPDGWAVTPSPGDGLCRMVCKADAECTAQSRVTKCKAAGALKLCQTGN